MPKKPRTIRPELNNITDVPSRQPNYSRQLIVPILYKSHSVIVIDKPFDVHIDGPYPITIENLINEQHEDMLQQVPNTPKRKLKFCHQLDFSTSGVLCLAFTRQECSKISTCFQFRTAEKSYLAVVLGHIQSASNNSDQRSTIIRTLIGDDYNDERKFRMIVVDEHDEEAIKLSNAKWGETSCTVLNLGYYRSRPVTKVLLKPTSGRRHQLRLHMKHIGHPICGDVTYAEDLESHRMMLHAWKLTLPIDVSQESHRPHKYKKHQITEETKFSSFEAPDPFIGEDFEWVPPHQQQDIQEVV